MKSLHHKHRWIVMGKLALGIALALLIAGADTNGLSYRDLLVGAGTALATTISLICTIEGGAPFYIIMHTLGSCITVDVVTGVWLNVNPILDKLIR